MNRHPCARLFTLLMLAACGSEARDAPATPSDVSTEGESATLTGDTGETGETSTTLTTRPFAPDDVRATVGPFQGGVDTTAWYLDAVDGDTVLRISNVAALGGANGPEARTLGPEEGSPHSCGLCLVLQTGCEVVREGVWSCEGLFMPEAGGEVVYDTLDPDVGGSWSGQLSGVRFVETDVDSSLQGMPVPGGETFTLSTWSFDVVLEAR